nr:MAG TPA: protein of unknown function (DUF4408) [Caudoviricetes sp.]
MIDLSFFSSLLSPPCLFFWILLYCSYRHCHAE